MQVINYKTEAEWLSLKEKDVTSTESPALFGLSPDMTELELYHLKKTGERLDFDETERMKWGTRLESAIATGVAEDMNLNVSPLKNYQRIPQINMGSSFDYEVTSGKYKNWLMEIKNVDGFIYKKTWDDFEAPEHIEVQAQHQMEVADREGCLIVAMVGGNTPKVLIRERDKEVGAALREKISVFWDDIRNGFQPAPDYTKDADFIISLHQESGDEILDMNGNPDFKQLLLSYASLKERDKALSKDIKAKKAELLDMIGDNAKKVLLDGFSVSCGMTKGTPPVVITPDMVGQTYGGRKDFRNFRVTQKKEAKK